MKELILSHEGIKGLIGILRQAESSAEGKEALETIHLVLKRNVRGQVSIQSHGRCSILHNIVAYTSGILMLATARVSVPRWLRGDTSYDGPSLADDCAWRRY